MQNAVTKEEGLVGSIAGSYTDEENVLGFNLRNHCVRVMMRLGADASDVERLAGLVYGLGSSQIKNLPLPSDVVLLWEKVGLLARERDNFLGVVESIIESSDIEAMRVTLAVCNDLMAVKTSVAMDDCEFELCCSISKSRALLLEALGEENSADIIAGSLLH